MHLQVVAKNIRQMLEFSNELLEKRTTIKAI